MDDMVILYMKAIFTVLKQYLSWRLLSYSFLKLQFTHMISNIHGQWSMVNVFLQSSPNPLYLGPCLLPIVNKNVS